MPIDTQPYSSHKAPVMQFDELKEPRIEDEIEELSLKITKTTKKLFELYTIFHQKMAKFKANKF